MDTDQFDNARGAPQAAIVNDALHRARTERMHFQHETRMLEMAMEELQEDETNIDAAEKTLLDQIDEREQQLVRYLLTFAVHSGEACSVEQTDAGKHEGKKVSGTSDTCTSPAASCSNALCTALEDYEKAQQAFAADMTEELRTARQEVHRLQHAKSCSQPSPATAEAPLHGTLSNAVLKRESMRTEVAVIRELTAEVNEEIDATLLEYGTTLFL